MLTCQPHRYEYKIPCQLSRLSKVRAWVRLHPLHWRVTYPPRQVNNVYFDTVDYRSLNDNLSGIGARRKLRIRWYGPDIGRITDGCFELKCKRGLVGWKVLCPLGFKLDLRHRPWSELLDKIRRHAPVVARHWLDSFPEPTLVNQYWRAYYETTNGDLRLTIDTDLQSYTQRLHVQPNLQPSAALESPMIVELKSPLNHEAYAQLVEVLQSLPLRTGRYSKYVQGTLTAPQFDEVKIL